MSHEILKPSRPKSILTFLMVASASFVQAQTNIVFVTIDDLNRDSLGIYGCPVPDISPNLDALGHAGLRFEHAHVAAANCTPSRNVMVSGMYSHNNKVLAVSGEGSGNHATFPTLPDVFRAAGYHAGIMGKNSHQQPFHPYSGWDVEYDTYGSTRDPENIYSKLSAAFSDAAALGKPLFFNLNIYDPHVGWYKWDHKLGIPEATDPDPDPSRIYTRNDVPYPSFFPALSTSEMAVGFEPGYDIMDEVAAYYNTVKRADDSIGRMMDAIADAGATSNTIIIVVSDHGVELVGAKTQIYHHSSVSPMFVIWPGVTSSNTVDSSHMINSIDFLPSFCELIGQPIPADIDGKSFIPIVKGEEPADWREFIYKEHSVGHNMRAVQTTNMLYIFNPWSNGTRTPTTVTKSHASWRAIEAAGLGGSNPEAAVWVEQFEHRTVEELYDTSVDPDCKVNLFTNSAYAAQLASLQSILEQEMLASGDDEILAAFQNRGSAAALEQYIADDGTMRSDMKTKPEHTRDVFYNPHDDWMLIGHTIFEPFGEWGLWTPEASGINLNASRGDAAAGDSCVEFNGGVADVSRLIVTNALDTSVFDQLKIDVAVSDNAAFSGGATVAFQYNDGTGWQTFQTINSAGKNNLVFELPGGGLPDTLLFGIMADLNGSGGSIYLDNLRFTGWQDWAAAPTNAPFDASGMGHVRIGFDFETENFSGTDKLLLEYFDGSAWTNLREYGFDYVLGTNTVYSDLVDMNTASHTFPTNVEFRFRSESTGSGQSFAISNYSIQTRLASESVILAIPPTANPDSYGEDAPKAIVVPASGILGNDVSGNGGVLSALLVGQPGHGILELNADGSFVYAATNGFIGADSFSYVAFDGGAYSATTTVSLAINEATLSPTIFFDDFESGDMVEGEWEYENEAKSTYYMTSAAYNGSYGANERNGGAITKTVSTVDYTDIGLKYWRKGNTLTDPGDALVVEWSTNGSSWIVVESTTDENWSYSEISLPASAAGQPTLSVRFGVNSSLWAHKAYFDDILIQGTPMAAGGAITNFSDWAATHGVAEGSEYVIDYAFNINPHLSERYALPTSGNSGLPIWELSESEDKLVLEFVRRKQAGDLTYAAQFTNSLMTNWTDAVSSETIVPIDDEFERVTVADDVAVANATNRFGRIIVIQK